MHPPQRRPSPDIGVALKVPFEDPQWFKKGLLVGLVSLIPLVGQLAMFGWAREVYDRGRLGQPGLPDLDLGRHMGYGAAPMLAMLNLALPMLAMVMVMMGVGLGSVALSEALGISNDAQSALTGLVFLVGQGMFMLSLFGLQVLVPELLRRGYNGEAAPLLRPGPTVAAVTARPGDYILVLLGLLVANVIGSLGAFACYLGIFVTMPLGLASSANLLAQWDRQIRGGPTTGLPDLFD
jgi:hypothetical protein